MDIPFDEQPGSKPAFDPKGFVGADYLHEAGHAVVALSLGVMVEGISQNENGVWKCRLGPYDEHSKKDVALIAVAGRIAELKYGLEVSDADGWVRYLLPDIAEVQNHGRGEPDYVDFYCAWEKLDAQPWRTLLLECCTHIEQLFVSVGAAVLDIASRLYQEESLTGDQVKALYESHGDGVWAFGEHE